MLFKGRFLFSRDINLFYGNDDQLLMHFIDQAIYLSF